MFYANHCLSEDGEDLETLVLENHIGINKHLFKDIFGSSSRGMSSI